MPPLSTVLAITATAALASGCVTAPFPSRTDAPRRLPQELATHYDYPRLNLEAEIKTAEEKSGYRIQRLNLVSRGDANFRPMRVDWYRPTHPGRLPAVIFSPILAGNDLYIREFARFFCARGMHSVIVYRHKEVFSSDRNLQEIETHFRESVIGLRRAIDWLETQKAVDSQRIGTFGISLGAILTSLLAAVEPRVQANVFGLPAGHLPEILMASQDKAIRKRRRSYLERHGLSDEETLKRLKEAILSDPIRFAPAIDPKKSLVIGGVFDRVLGFHRTLEFWRACGRPRLIVLPTGHYTAALATPYLKIATYSFLKRALNSSRITDA